MVNTNKRIASLEHSKDYERAFSSGISSNAKYAQEKKQKTGSTKTELE